MQRGYHFKLMITIVLVITFFSACEKLVPSSPAKDELLDGPVEGLTAAQSMQFLRGDIAFNDDVFTSETGLGPIFVATSCSSCHAGDGKGHPFTTLTRFGQFDSTGNQYLHMGGPQLQNRSLPGFDAEQIPPGATFSKFTPPANTGLGYVELVSDDDILAMADPSDADGDGISGVPNWSHLPWYLVPAENAVEQGGKYITRFGKKAGAYNLLHQTVNAYNQDMGVTSDFESKDVYSGIEADAEVSTNTVNDVVFYLQTLKAPIQRKQDDPEVLQGKSLFITIGCESCHRQTLTTGNSDIAALSNKSFHPYTDLLLHDMGSELDDGYTEGNAKTYEWRTPPLWGLGLSPNSQGGQYYLLHDGRATTIEDAILYHGGEASGSKNKFQDLSTTEKNALLKFLESL
ncbi:MAG TPA: di-heme oxidoredictase family protein [Chitinophagales bacterium]|nr:di-heme oxidoredictase family protein [Chitinophagales bacterium]